MAVSFNTLEKDIEQHLEYATIGISPEYEAIQNSLTMIAGGTEMLRVSQDGFYVRGVRVPADDKEAETVYNAFKQFLTWAELNRR
jgi:hypothetical protein